MILKAQMQTEGTRQVISSLRWYASDGLPIMVGDGGGDFSQTGAALQQFIASAVHI